MSISISAQGNSVEWLSVRCSFPALAALINHTAVGNNTGGDDFMERSGTEQNYGLKYGTD